MVARLIVVTQIHIIAGLQIHIIGHKAAYKGFRLDESAMSTKEIEAYYAGYDENEKDGNYKDYG